MSKSCAAFRFYSKRFIDAPVNYSDSRLGLTPCSAGRPEQSRSPLTRDAVGSEIFGPSEFSHGPCVSGPIPR